MGGTSCDIGLVLEGEEQFASEFQVAWGVPVTIPCVAVQTIGAGGGSIAWIDKGGLLHVGPRSAGADPGPVAYGLGGTEPTVTDANLVLGRLDPGYFLGGAMALDSGASHAAYETLGASLGLSREEAALAAVRTIDENMANAIRLIAVERGVDTREFALVALGGAGPLHARSVASLLGIRTVLVPPHPGLCSAFGAMIAEARVDRARTYYARSTSVDPHELGAALASLVNEAVAELRASVDVDAPAVECRADLRYLGQNYELEVAVPENRLDGSTWAALLDRFADEHERQYGFALPGETIELITLRVAVRRAATVPELATATSPASGTDASVRPVWVAGDRVVECPVYRRETLPTGWRIEGPAIVEDFDSTTLVSEGDLLTLATGGVLVLELAEP
jgi:N-methylhydantoinase A